MKESKSEKVGQSCPALCDPMDYTVHGIFQARILEWIAFPFSRRSSQPRDWTQVSCIAGRFWATREAYTYTPSLLGFLALQVTIVHWVGLYELYSMLKQVTYSMLSTNSVYVSRPISRVLPPPPPLPFGIHAFVPYFCDSISALQIRSSIPFFGFACSKLVRNLPAVWKIWAQSLDWEDPLEKGKATHSSILA